MLAKSKKGAGVVGGAGGSPVLPPRKKQLGASPVAF